MTKSQAAIHLSSSYRFRRSNMHDINPGRQPFLLPWGLPSREVFPQLLTQLTPLPQRADLQQISTGTNKKHHPATTVHQQESAPLSSHFHFIVSTRQTRSIRFTPELPLLFSLYPPTSQNQSRRYITPIVSNQFSQFQPPQCQSNYHKQHLVITTSKISHCLIQLQIRKSKKKIHLRLACDYEFHTSPLPTSKALFLTARRRSKENLPYLGPRKKILNSPSCTQNLLSLDLHQK